MIHGWDFNPKMHWYQWVKKELEKLNFKVIIPTMPNPSEPKIEEWVTRLKQVVEKLDADTYFIGHSLGCQAIMRFLENEDFTDKVPMIIFVAGWFKLDNLENKEVEKIAGPWINNPIDFNKIKSKIKKLVVFFSSNEPYGYVKYNAKIFQEKLGAKVIIEKNKGHFTAEDKITAMPEIIEIIKNQNEMSAI